MIDKDVPQVVIKARKFDDNYRRDTKKNFALEDVALISWNSHLENF